MSNLQEFLENALCPLMGRDDKFTWFVAEVGFNELGCPFSRELHALAVAKERTEHRRGEIEKEIEKEGKVLAEHLSRFSNQNNSDVHRSLSGLFTEIHLDTLELARRRLEEIRRSIECTMDRVLRNGGERIEGKRDGNGPLRWKLKRYVNVVINEFRINESVEMLATSYCT